MDVIGILPSCLVMKAYAVNVLIASNSLRFVANDRKNRGISCLAKQDIKHRYPLANGSRLEIQQNEINHVETIGFPTYLYHPWSSDSVLSRGIRSSLFAL